MVYRNADDVLRQRRDDLLRQRRREIEALPAGVTLVYVGRQARLWAGAAGVAGALVLAASAALRHRGETAILTLSWACMTLVYFGARPAAEAAIRRRLEDVFTAGRSVHADLLRLDDLTPTTVVRDAARRVERASVALPMSALALLLPLSLHLLVATLLGIRGPASRDFDAWICISLLFVGHCHLVVVGHAWRFAGALRRVDDVCYVGFLAERTGWRAWGQTIASSLAAGMVVLLIVPIAGVALVLVAPALVAATGLTFIPSMFTRMGRRVRDERLVLAPPT